MCAKRKVAFSEMLGVMLNNNMEEIIKRCFDIRNTSREYSIKFREPEVILPEYKGGCFSMIFNHSTLTLEVLDHYSTIWKSVITNKSNEQIEEAKQENGERIISITKSLFISSMSAIEYNIRNIILHTNNHILSDTINRKEKLIDSFSPVFDDLDDETKNKLRSFRKKLKDTPPFDSIGQVMLKSKSSQIINELEYKQWSFLLNTRNIVVHNNSIASKDFSLMIDGREYLHKAGVMLRDNLDFFIELTILAIELSINWIKESDALHPTAPQKT